MDQADVLRANPAALPALPRRTASPAPNLLPVIARIVEARCSIPASRSVLAAVTGIDFKTALEWVIARGQEGLPVEETIHAYRTIYFPAQEIHFERDDPRAAATGIVGNDARLVGAPAS